MKFKVLFFVFVTLLLMANYAMGKPKVTRNSKITNAKKAKQLKHAITRAKTARTAKNGVSTKAKEESDKNHGKHPDPNDGGEENNALEIMSLDKYFQSLHSPDYIFGRCNIVPDAALAKKEQTLKGSISFRQQLQGGATEIYINITGFNTDDTVQKHGFHVHSFGDLSSGCSSTGDHYNPFGTLHGAPDDHPALRHFGDLGNIEEDKQGRVIAQKEDHLISLLGPFSALGRAVVIHSHEDDLGTKKTELSLISGSAGKAIACCVIGLSDNQQWPTDKPIMAKETTSKITKIKRRPKKRRKHKILKKNNLKNLKSVEKKLKDM